MGGFKKADWPHAFKVKRRARHVYIAYCECGWWSAQCAVKTLAHEEAKAHQLAQKQLLAEGWGWEVANWRDAKELSAQAIRRLRAREKINLPL
jgi:hypothetical protein